jgi:hypothetical protein
MGGASLIIFLPTPPRTAKDPMMTMANATQ